MASSDRFYMPFQTAWNTSGLVTAGAKLYFYVTGTTTPKDTYSDAALSTPNANPVVADAAGRFPTIFLGSGDYKVVLNDANDVQIWTADPVAKATTTAASTSAAGTVELATQAEGLLGTSSTLVPPVSVVADMIQQGFSYGSTGGTANALTGTPAITPPALAAGMIAILKASATNTGATTLNWAGLGVTSVKVAGGSGATACSGGEIVNGNTYVFTYSAADACWLVSPIGEGVGALNAFTEDTSPDGTTDFWGMWDASAKLPKKVKPQSLAASQTQLEASSVIGNFTTPGRQQFHPSAAKAWARVDGTGTAALADSYNTTSLTDNGTGDYTTNWTTSLSGANYPIFVSTEATGGSGAIRITTIATSSARFQNFNTATGAALDVDPCTVVAFGDI